jgi:hypothetical protein
MEENHQVPEKIMRQIIALMQIKEGSGATQAEIENASARVTELLLKYNLEMSMIEAKQEEKDQKKKVTQDIHDLNTWQSKTDGNWVISLFNTISYYNMCRVVHIRTTRMLYDQGKIMIIGRSYNIEIVYYTVQQLIGKINSSRRRAWAIYQGLEKANTFKRGFCIGAVNGISVRLGLQRRAMEEEELRKRSEEARNNTGDRDAKGNLINGLMLTNMLEKSEKENQELFDELFHPDDLRKPRKKPDLKSQDGLIEGYKAGRNMEINKGIDDSQKSGYLNG